MKICILKVDNENSNSAISKYEPTSNPINWIKTHKFEQWSVSANNSKTILHQLLKKDFDIFINLCDGAENEDRPGIEVVKILEKAGKAFTGAGSTFYEPTRIEMKNACNDANINYPKGLIVEKNYNVGDLLNTLQFPMIVKHFNSYNSIGLTKKSIVNNVNELTIQASKMILEFGSAMIEEYIEGNEYTALVVENATNSDEPIVFTPMQIIFPEGEKFKHFDLKWKSHISMAYIPVNDKNIADKIKKMSAEMFKKMNGSGYARCDIRMNKNGELFMLEINPNCSIYFPKEDPSSADEILFYENNGHELFTKLILESAFNRCK
jgi:D-alanine-D-alanine ligase